MSGSAAAVLTKPAFRKIEWLPRDIAVERRPDGVIILKSRIPLQPYEKHIPASLAKWAKQAPEARQAATARRRMRTAAVRRRAMSSAMLPYSVIADATCPDGKLDVA